MTLRAKTRSRKGRDLKRLDGVKRRMTRRRRVRVQKQRGGAVAGIIDWLAAVDNMTLYKETPETYEISAAKNDDIKLPSVDDSTNDSFKLDVYGGAADARAIAKSVQVNLMDLGLLSEGLQNTAFAGSVTSLMDTIMEDGDIKQKLEFLAEVEKSLRSAKDSTDTSAQQITISSLAKTDIYPLYIWAFAYAAPEEEEITPALFSERETKRLVSETPGTVSSESISKPAAQVDTAP